MCEMTSCVEVASARKDAQREETHRDRETETQRHRDQRDQRDTATQSPKRPKRDRDWETATKERQRRTVLTGDGALVCVLWLQLDQFRSHVFGRTLYFFSCCAS